MARSRATARELIEDGAVTVNGRVATKASYAVVEADRIEVVGDGPAWVGRGAAKLDAAMNRWPTLREQVAGASCVDVGASTGGFTQVLLHYGAEHVIAIDVGTGQLASAIARDDRVEDRSTTHVLDVTAHDLHGPISVIVVDLSFISLRRVLDHLASWCAEHTSIVVLVKPQFEVGREALGRGGVVRSPRSRVMALDTVLDAAYLAGLGLRGALTSPITGTQGNVEYLLWVGRQQPGMMDQADAHALIRSVT